MILQIGRKGQNRPGGFTLLELIIVATIIGVLVAASIPLFRTTFRDLELKDAAYNIGKLIRYGQQRAIIEERIYRLLFDFDKKTYRLAVKNEDRNEDIISAEDKKSPTWKKIKGRFGKYFSLPEDLRFKGEQNKITFLPNGRCDKFSIYLLNQKNKIITITTNGRAGYVEVSEVKEME
jgi:prepilin-type N-terminal cleavage/methylation domain-containing protein